MFAKAVGVAFKFTRPLVLSAVTHRGEATTSMGSLVIVNKDGWVLTAFHMLKTAQHAEASRTSYARLLQQQEKIVSDPTINSKKKRQLLKQCKPKAKDTYCTDHSLFWGFSRIQASEVIALPDADLAVARLDGFDPDWCTQYPTFKTPAGMQIGTSLCTLGYPFHKLEPSYNKDTGFNLPNLPPHPFPIEGIATRFLKTGEHQSEGKPSYDIVFIESSNPGLKGQSGGPVVDVAGTVWGIQIRTSHYPLGFEPVVTDSKGRKTVEHQFLNIGQSVHSKTILAFLDEAGVAYNVSSS